MPTSRSYRVLSVMLTALVLAQLGGCARRSRKETVVVRGSTQGFSQATAGNITLSLEARDPGGAARSIFDAGQVAEFAVEVRNRGGTAETLSFPTAQTLEVEVRFGAQPIWRYGAGQAFQQVLTRITLAPGGHVELTAQWPLVNAAGQSVAPGDYDVHASLPTSAGPALPTIPPVRITVRAAATQPPVNTTPTPPVVTPPVITPPVVTPTPSRSLDLKVETRDAAGNPKTTFQAQEPVHLVLTLTNAGSLPEDLLFQTLIFEHSLKVRDSQSQIVWDKHLGIGQILVPGFQVVRTLDPGKSLVYDGVWDQTHSSVLPPIGTGSTPAYVSPGTYRAEGQVFATAQSGTPVPFLAAASFDIQAAPAPTPTPTPTPTSAWTTKFVVKDYPAFQPQTQFALGGIARLELSVTNNQAVPDSLLIRDIWLGQIFVRSALGATVRTFPDFPLSPVGSNPVAFKAGETKTLVFDWDQTDDHGRPVPPGSYRCEGEIRVAAGSTALTQPAAVTITVLSTPPLPSRTVVISGVAVGNNGVPSNVDFYVGMRGFPTLLVDAGAFPGDTPAVTAQKLLALLPWMYTGSIQVLPNGDAELEVLRSSTNGAALAGPIEVSKATSRDPVQKIRVK